MSANRRQIPTPPPMADPTVYAWAGRLVAEAQHAIDDLAVPAPLGITVSGVTPASTFNAATASLAQTASALGQLIKALQLKGVIV
jgi:hypothetical protein